jgi:hypothetical protein
LRPAIAVLAVFGLGKLAHVHLVHQAPTGFGELSAQELEKKPSKSS